MERWIEIRPVEGVRREWLAGGLVTQAEWNFAAGLRNEARRAEWLGWRAIVRERFFAEGFARIDSVGIGYGPGGEPVLLGEGSGIDGVGGGHADRGGMRNPLGYIGVSHTKGWVAVVWSPEPCAIDVELKTRSVSPVAAERMGIVPNVEAWCAWEAAYKYRCAAGIEAAPEMVRFHDHPELVVATIG